MKKRKECLGKLDRRISKSGKKDQKLINLREELSSEVESYAQRCSDVEKQSLEKIEKLQNRMFKTVADGFRSVLAEETLFLLESDKKKINSEPVAHWSETYYDTFSIGSGVRYNNIDKIGSRFPPKTIQQAIFKLRPCII